MVIGPYRFGAAGTLIDNSGVNPRPNGFSGWERPGGGVANVNANVTLRDGSSFQILPSFK